MEGMFMVYATLFLGARPISFGDVGSYLSAGAQQRMETASAKKDRAAWGGADIAITRRRPHGMPPALYLLLETIAQAAARYQESCERLIGEKEGEGQ